MRALLLLVTSLFASLALAQDAGTPVPPEPSTQLQAIARGVKQLYDAAGRPEGFRFPAATPLTPKASCCKTAGTCHLDANTFSHQTWLALGFIPPKELAYRYEFKPVGSGKTAGFVARAVGEPGCKGKREVYELSGQLKDGQLVIGELRRGK